jgi:hypothetical protein
MRYSKLSNFPLYLRNATVVAVFAGSTNFAFAQKCETPLPSDLNVSTLKDQPLSQFLGIWGDGMWDKVLCHTLVIESLPTPTTAVVVYSHGAYSGWNIRAPGFYRMQGTLDGTTLKLNFPPSLGARAEYQIVDGKMQGKYFSRTGVVTTELSRKP